MLYLIRIIIILITMITLEYYNMLIVSNTFKIWQQSAMPDLCSIKHTVNSFETKRDA